MEDELKSKIDWILIFVWEFGKKHNLDLKDSFFYLKKYKGIKFIEKNYSYVHTQSFFSMVNEIAEYCNRQGGPLL